MLARMARKKIVKRAGASNVKKAVVRGAEPDPRTCAAARSEVGKFCRGLPGATVDIKWGDNLTFCIGGKIFAGMQCDDPGAVGFKCDDVEFERLTKVEGIIPAPYAARFGWVKVTRVGVLKQGQLEKLIRRSYELVRAGLPARVRSGPGQV
jgi:predicted DNA-binding protein (MmcQ/YjbR family)